MSTIRTSFSLMTVAFSLSIATAQTVTTLRPGPADGKDALIKSCVPCGNWDLNNYGTDPSLPAIAWTNGGNVSNIRALLAFDLDTIPVGSTIIEARLSLYQDPISNEGQHSTLSGPNNCLIQRVVAPWDEATVTWNDQPATTVQNQLVLPASVTADQDYPDIDVTDLITDMYQDPNGNHGFLLSMDNENYYRRVVFASSDHPKSALRPKLEITYLNDVGIDDVGNVNFMIHPSPTSGRILITSAMIGEVVNVYDMMGRVLHSERIIAPEHTVDLVDLPPGSYFVRLSSSGSAAVHGIEKQ